MKWYLARIVFRIICGEGDHAAQFDEQVRLILAADEYQAMEKAMIIGRKEEAPFMNQRMQTVRWQLEGVVEIMEIQELRDGMELFSKITEEEDGERYAHDLKQKADTLMQQLGQLQVNWQ